jgi:hypothetical protein
MSAAPPLDFEERKERLFGKKGDAAGQEAKGPGRPSKAAQIIELVHEANAVLTHTVDREAFVTIVDEDKRRVTMAIASTECKQWLSFLYWRKTTGAVGSEAIKSASDVLAAEAIFSGAQQNVFHRIAHVRRSGDLSVYVDLGAPDRRVVQITKGGWELIESTAVPVLFRRPRAMTALAIPQRDGSLAELRNELFQNVPDGDWMMIVGFLVGIFQPEGVRAILNLIGGQGSAKSTLGRIIVSLTDPCDVPLRAMPRDEQALVIAAMSRRLLGFDNASVIAPEMADAICRLASGAGIGGRELYSDREEAFLKAIVAMLITSIEPMATTRPDFQDRTLPVYLESFASLGLPRRTEREVEQILGDMKPRLLGALYDAVSCAIRNHGEVDQSDLPRLADFALWAEAAGPSQGWQPGEFTDVMDASRSAASVLAVESSVVASLIVKLMTLESSWRGTSTDLLDELRGLATDEERKNRSFPQNPTRLSGQLRRLQPPLAEVGVWIGFNRDRRNRQIILDRNDAKFGIKTEHQRPAPPRRPAQPFQEPLVPEPDADGRMEF